MLRRLRTTNFRIQKEGIQRGIEPDVNRTRNLLIWSQTRYHCATDPLRYCFCLYHYNILVQIRLFAAPFPALTCRSIPLKRKTIWNNILLSDLHSPQTSGYHTILQSYSRYRRNTR
ncbi:hypothetical protein Sango_1574400 [Sesamum angolense]|uniref:Uncharacterized protein n=1 Tax=Sesamum angolense TaxID=2727404 RepID=A0AAE1WQH4_9LAMI|nr:hypothetical protein Sango_1574400 [Sesamum angolense]